jgi:hypothetical protein
MKSLCMIFGRDRGLKVWQVLQVWDPYSAIEVVKLNPCGEICWICHTGDIFPTTSPNARCSYLVKHLIMSPCVQICSTYSTCGNAFCCQTAKLSMKEMIESAVIKGPSRHQKSPQPQEAILQPLDCIIISPSTYHNNTCGMLPQAL